MAFVHIADLKFKEANWHFRYLWQGHALVKGVESDGDGTVERTSLTFKHFLKNILFFCFWRRRIELKCPERGNAKSLLFLVRVEWWSWVQPGSALNEKLDFFFFEKQEFELSLKFVDRGMEDIGRTSYTNVKTKRNKNAK